MNFNDYNPQPLGYFPYKMVTTTIAEHSHGVMWEADLFMVSGANSIKVGTITQMGRGGCDEVTISDPELKKQWKLDVADSFPDSEEDATFYLMTEEEDLLLAKAGK